ncbi:MAG: hypothetical protein FWG66_04575 [Spirochaetes bacterium]|nr:hypothetical protein [Spirochaetota bacterium]
MAFSDKMKELLDQGMAAGKDIAVKAGAKAQDLGEKGMIKYNIMQLESQAQRALTRLGNEVYRSFNEGGKSSISRDDPLCKSIIDEIEMIRDTLEKKEQELKNR